MKGAYKKMMIFSRRNFGLLLLLFMIFAVSVLSSCKDNALKFKNDGNTGNLIDEENGRYYIFCKGYLQAAAIRPEVYAKGDRKEKLYEVDGLDPAEWLSEDISNQKIVPFLFREQSVEEPKFEEFEAERIYITYVGEVNIAIDFMDDKEKIDIIVNDYLYGKKVPEPEIVTEKFNFNFASEKYKGLYFVFEYLVDEKNNAYLYDRWNKRCVSCSIKIFGGNGVGN